MQALKRSARELIEGSQDDSSWVRVQMQELSTRWETVCALSISKQSRLEAALRQVKSALTPPAVPAGSALSTTQPPCLGWDTRGRKCLEHPSIPSPTYRLLSKEFQ